MKHRKIAPGKVVPIGLHINSHSSCGCRPHKWLPSWNLCKDKVRTTLTTLKDQCRPNTTTQYSDPDVLLGFNVYVQQSKKVDDTIRYRKTIGAGIVQIHLQSCDGGGDGCQLGID